MKIDLSSFSQETAAAARAASVRSNDQAAGGARPAADSGDRVELSADVRVMTAAMKAAEEAPEIREDRVARAKALLESGDLGSDLLKLADKIIDHLVTR